MEANNNVGGGEQQKEKVTFTPEQQQKLDKLVKDAKLKESKRIEKLAEEKIKKIEEAERLKNMSESERKDAELKAAQEKIRQYETQKLTDQFKVELAERGLPKELAELIPVTDADRAKQAVDFFAKFKSDVEKTKDEEISKLTEKVNNLEMKGKSPRILNTTNKAIDPVFKSMFTNIQKRKGD